MDRNKAKVLRDSMQEALESVSKEHGVSINIGRCTFSSDNASFKVEVSDVSGDGMVLTREANDFQVLARAYGLKPSDLGRKFLGPAGKTYRICGANPKARGFPIIAEDEKGKPYKFPAYVVSASNLF